MIVLDTNVVSEGMKVTPHPTVDAWLRRLDPDEAAVTTITMAEILIGIEILPSGRRRTALAEGYRMFVDRIAPERFLVFGQDAALRFATIGAVRRKSGRPISLYDAMIAAIVAANGATLATRDVRDFAGCGIAVIDPWSS